MFKRKITTLLEKLITTNEGRQAPITVEVLQRVDSELADIKKQLKALQK